MELDQRGNLGSLERREGAAGVPAAHRHHDLLPALAPVPAVCTQQPTRRAISRYARWDADGQAGVPRPLDFCKRGRVTGAEVL